MSYEPTPEEIRARAEELHRDECVEGCNLGADVWMPLAEAQLRNEAAWDDGADNLSVRFIAAVWRFMDATNGGDGYNLHDLLDQAVKTWEP